MVKEIAFGELSALYLFKQPLSRLCLHLDLIKMKVFSANFYMYELKQVIYLRWIELYCV